jgi:hypothetical protein
MKSIKQLPNTGINIPAQHQDPFMVISSLLIRGTKTEVMHATHGSSLDHVNLREKHRQSFLLPWPMSPRVGDQRGKLGTVLRLGGNLRSRGRQRANGTFHHGVLDVLQAAQE